MIQSPAATRTPRSELVCLSPMTKSAARAAPPCAAIAAARAIRERARTLGREDGPDVRVKVGIHWGATLTVGQVSTGGRLEVSALGDEMKEAARIESAAAGDIVLASKDLIERLSQADAKQLSIKPDSLTYRTIAELTGAEKEVRDAGSIAVVEL
jgi:class 3 adenylate cyclase